MTFINEQFGPTYPDLGASVMKHRRICAKAGSIAMMNPEDRYAYGDAVEKSIRAKQRAELQRVLPGRNVHCASGTNHNNGEDIDRAIKQQHRAAIMAAPSQIRRARTDEEWRDMYERAMEQKRKREAEKPVIKITKAKYAKGMMAVCIQSAADGFKTSAHRIIADNLKCRYSNRERAYIAPPSKVAKFKALIQITN